MTAYGYGIDLGQMLDYTSIVVLEIKEKHRIKTLRQKNNMSYPEIIDDLFSDLIRRFPPAYICIDYTSEKAVAEEIEGRLNPSFKSPHSSGYRQWKYVTPVVFNQDTKLRLKQNAKSLFESKRFVLPITCVNLRIRSLVEELKQQTLREAGEPGRNGLLRFPKPQGHHNDLIIALELALLRADEFLEEPSSGWEITRPDPYERYVCQECRKGNHHGKQRPPVPGPDLTPISCPCKICDNL